MMLLSTREPRLLEPKAFPEARDSLVIGLINNMPGPALRSTELQFRALLSSAAPNVSVDLRLYSLLEYERTEAGRSQLHEGYGDLNNLWPSTVDALIVTGTEPRARALPLEPYWDTLTKLIRWAEEHTISTIWSCLTAHAAALYLDGVERCPLNKKLFGVFKCRKAMTHGILDGLPASWYIPHSRRNDLPEDALISRGYSILSKSARAGVDMAVRPGRSLFLLLQCHPEYGPDVLFREYKRDVARFLRGESNCCPDLPEGYFEKQTARALRAMSRRSIGRPDVSMLSNLAVMAPVRPIRAWGQAATTIYANWLSYVVEQKSTRLRRDGVANAQQATARPAHPPMQSS